MKLASIILGLSLLAFNAGAQVLTLPNNGERSSRGGLRGSEKEMLLGKPLDMKDIPMEYDRYSDDRFKEFDEEMKEKSWNYEDTAWERACEVDTKESYQRYIAIYPNGAHRGEANRRFIDRQVKDIMDSAHNELPEMERVLADDNSPTSTVLIKNNTEYDLTVYYSGIDSKSIIIAPGGRGAITLTNGPYKVAASVPPAHIRPYAGRTQLIGGRYETGYWVVRM